VGHRRSNNVRGNYGFKCNLAKGKYTYSVYAIDLAGSGRT